MNKFLARTIDKLAIDLLSPRFNVSEMFKEHNLSLLDKPPLPPKRLIATPKLFLKQIGRKGAVDIYDYAFPSRVETDSLKNNTVYGRYYKISNGAPKSTVILLHGMFESRHRYQEKHALNLVRNGHNCLVMTLPYHIERAAKAMASGSQFLSTDLKSTFEALRQAMKDVMGLINWLTVNGEKKIGLIGISFGALIAGLVASTTRKINYLVLLAPVVTPLQITGYIKSGKAVENRIIATGLSKEQLFKLFEPWHLLNNKPVMPVERTFVVEAAHDALIPSDSIESVWHAWGKPRISRYGHGHMSFLATRRIFRDINAFLGEAFTPRTSAGLSK